MSWALAIQLGQGCTVVVPGWAALGVAALLTAPRLVSQYLDGQDDGG